MFVIYRIKMSVFNCRPLYLIWFYVFFMQHFISNLMQVRAMLDVCHVVYFCMSIFFYIPFKNDWLMIQSWIQLLHTNLMGRCGRDRMVVGVLDTTIYDKVFQWLAAGQLFSPGTPVSSTNKTDLHDRTEILLKVALNTINQTKPHKFVWNVFYYFCCSS